MKFINKFSRFSVITTSFCLFSLFGFLGNQLEGKEEETIFGTYNVKAKASIFLEKDYYVHSCHFDDNNVVMKTYFKDKVEFNKDGILNLQNQPKPIKQEITFFWENKTFISKEFCYEKWDDNAITLAFQYNINLKKDSKKYNAITTSICQEVIEGEPLYRYMLWRNFK